MASIQQSLNQMLGSVAGIATAGSYIYSQSPEYKRKQELKGLEKQEAQLVEASGELGYVAGVNDIPEDSPAWRAGEEIAKKRITVAQRAHELDPTEQRAENLAQARSWYETDYLEAPSRRQEEQERAEADAMERYSIRARILGVSESQLRAREEMLRNKGGNG